MAVAAGCMFYLRCCSHPSLSNDCFYCILILKGADIPHLPAPFNHGHYYAPTVLGVTTKMDIWRDEVFGPVVVAVPFNTEQVRVWEVSCCILMTVVHM